MSPELAAAQREYAEATAPPQGVVHEEGWLSRALRKYDEAKQHAKQWARDMGEAVGIKLFDPPAAQSARDNEIKAFSGRPEAEAAREYARGYDIGHGVQQVSGDIGGEAGERTADAAIATAEAETGGRLAGVAIGGVKGLRRGVRGASAEAKTADQAIEAAQAEGRVSRSAVEETGEAAASSRKAAGSALPPSTSTAEVAATSDRPILGGQIRPYNEARRARIPGYEDHHLDPPLGRNDPGYGTAPTIPVRNDNAGRRIAGGENFHTGTGGFQMALNEHIKELGYTRADWNALPTETRQIVLKRFYASLGIPYPGRR